MSYTFDIANKIIQLTTTDELDMLDLYSRWKEEVALTLGGADQALRSIKEPLAGSVFIGPYYFIMNNWQIRPVDSNHELVIAGAVIQDDTSTLSPFKLDDLTNNVQIVRTVATEVQVVETTSPVTTQDISDISTAVWQEPILGHTAINTMGWYQLLSGRILLDTTVVGTPSTTYMQLAAGSAIDAFYHDQLIYIVSGTGIGQTRIISNYTGSTKGVTVDEPWVVAPQVGDRVIIQTDHAHPISQIVDHVMSRELTP